MMSAPGGRPQAGERGFALLIVFAMAAIVAMYLYMQLPRVAFESERDREQILIDRGEQYKRAIYLYVNAWKKYPQKIEDLENTNNKRYLRKRYIDPMTGKDEWRLIHINAAGMLTDSLVQKPTTGPDGKPLDPSAAGSTGSTTASATDPNAPPDVNAAVMRRPSDVVGNAYTQPNANQDSNDPATWAPIALTPIGQPGQPTAPPSGAVGFNGGMLGQTPGQTPGQAGMMPGQFPLPGQQGFNAAQNQFKVDANGQLVPFQPTAVPQNGAPAAAPAANGGISAPGINPANGFGQNPATVAINNQLTNPNPTPGANGLGTAGGMQSGGIAGVATNYKGASIKTYNKRQKYQEWEFIFSLNDQTNSPATGRNPLTPGQNGLGPGQNGAAGGGTTGFSQTTQPVTPATPSTTGNP
jgi:hypothetical protein